VVEAASVDMVAVLREIERFREQKGECKHSVISSSHLVSGPRLKSRLTHR